jgi:hypothetical protein
MYGAEIRSTVSSPRRIAFARKGVFGTCTILTPDHVVRSVGLSNFWIFESADPRSYSAGSRRSCDLASA